MCITVINVSIILRREYEFMYPNIINEGRVPQSGVLQGVVKLPPKAINGSRCNYNT
jgi:hypothetical protein